MNAEKNLNKNYIDTIKKLKKNSDEYAGFINSCFNSFLQFYNSRVICFFFVVFNFKALLIQYFLLRNIMKLLNLNILTMVII